MSDRAVVRLSVAEGLDLTPRMRRVVLSGPDAGLFAGGMFDERVKLVFADADTGLTRPPRLVDGRLEWPRPFPESREYTIRRHDGRRVAIDFVLHDGGLAAGWARTARPGDEIWAVGPKSDTVVPQGTGFWLLLGDETALPAIARCLESLPPDARGLAAIEVAGPEERQDLTGPGGLAVRWLYRAEPAGGSPLLAGVLEETGPLPADGYLWAAGEAGAMKPIRAWARAHRLDRRTCNISGYWRARRGGRGKPVTSGSP